MTQREPLFRRLGSLSSPYPRLMVSYLYRYQTADMKHERYVHAMVRRPGRPHPMEVGR